MIFIDKTKATNRVRGLNINKKMLDSCWDGDHYVNLRYGTVDKTEPTNHLVDEQHGLCCYCMRRLHIFNEENHKKNVTLEHVVPHKIKQEKWEADRAKYRNFSTLSDRNITICYGGELTDPTAKFGMPPFPHFLSYDNLVASCDGQALNEAAQEVPHHCCNNKRGDIFVEPLYFHENVADEISYDGRGHIRCAEEYVPYLDGRGVNIMCDFLNDVRLFWKQIADSEYTVEQVVEAENDESLRTNIIDDVFTHDPTGHWFFLMERHAWCIFSDYAWFYGYYRI